jgi:MFS transporter, FLVCR family, MFS-domain-containing protein 7
VSSASDLTHYLPPVVRDFGFTLTEVNWLGNIIACVYLPTAFLTPIITKRYGLKRCVCYRSSFRQHILISSVQCDIAAFLLLISGWVRYAGTARSLSKGGAYAFIIIGQVRKSISSSPPPALVLCSRQALSAVSQPVFQILAPKYSERWFDLKGRTTATMIISIGVKPFLVKTKFSQLTRPRFSESYRRCVGSAAITQFLRYTQVGACCSLIHLP